MFHSTRHPIDTLISIKLDGKRLVPVDYVRYLGMYIDKRLDWDVHIHHMCKKLSRANGILSKLRHNTHREVCLIVYYAIFFSHLIYGCNIWGLTTEENLKKVLQRKCVRIITISDVDSHANTLFIDLKLLKVRDVFLFFLYLYLSEKDKMAHIFLKQRILAQTDILNVTHIHLTQQNGFVRHYH